MENKNADLKNTKRTIRAQKLPHHKKTVRPFILLYYIHNLYFYLSIFTKVTRRKK